MVKYIECYPEYLELEEFLKRLMRILNLSFIPGKTLKSYRKYIPTTFLFYVFISAIFTILYHEQDLTIFLLRIIPVVGFSQLIAKSLSLHADSEELKTLFLYFQEAHRVHKFQLITDTSRIHLKKSLSTIKTIIRFAIPVMFSVGFGLASYFIYVDKMFLAIPGIFPTPNVTSFYQHIHQVSVLLLTDLIFIIEDSVIISIGFYFIAILNIFLSIIKHINTFLDINSKRQYLVQLYEIHCNILDKFGIFQKVFYYTITLQIATSVVIIMFIFFLLQTEGGIAFLPMFFSVTSQVGLVCLLGQLMYSQTERFSTELYLTNWWELGSKEQKMILIMMYISHRPIGLKLAGMYDINVKMFSDVMKAGISFCTLLSTFT
uniref:Odorant receptor n=1 Tax=Phlebotomus papatasi TaxID=29031 RepID=A0A3F2ZEH2_PHLPP